eukprot:7016796-Prymnesium_polylepis.1
MKYGRSAVDSPAAIASCKLPGGFSQRRSKRIVAWRWIISMHATTGSDFRRLHSSRSLRDAIARGHARPWKAPLLDLGYAGHVLLLSM